MLIFNRSYELIEVMKYRSYEVNLWTKSTNLKLMCNRSYEVEETLDISKDQKFDSYYYNAIGIIQ